MTQATTPYRGRHSAPDPDETAVLDRVPAPVPAPEAELASVEPQPVAEPPAVQRPSRRPVPRPELRRFAGLQVADESVIEPVRVATPRPTPGPPRDADGVVIEPAAVAEPVNVVPLAGESPTVERPAVEPLAVLSLAGEPVAVEPVAGEPVAAEPPADEPFAVVSLAYEQRPAHDDEPLADAPIVVLSLADEPHTDEPHPDEPHPDEPHRDEPHPDEPPAATRPETAQPTAPPWAAAIENAIYPRQPPRPARQQWETPAGFVPLQAARPSRRGVRIAVIAALVLAVLAGGGWLALQALHRSPAPAPVPAGATTSSFQSANGHYSAQFAHTPVEQQRTGSAAGATFTAYTATDGDTVVVSAAVTPGISSAQMPAFLHGELAALSARPSVASSSETNTTYQGSPALRAQLVGSSGKSLTVLAVGYSPTRVYLLMAPTGSEFDALEASFRPTP